METTQNLVRYSPEKLGVTVPNKKALERLDGIGVAMRTAGIILAVIYLVWVISAIVVAFVVLSQGTFLEKPLLDMPPFWSYWLYVVIFFTGLGLEAYASSKIQKFHRNIHQGEIVQVEIVQKAGTPLTRVFTVRGYTLANTLALQTRSEQISPSEDPDSYYKYTDGDLFDNRDDKLVAASLKA